MKPIMSKETLLNIWLISGNCCLVLSLLSSLGISYFGIRFDGYEQYLGLFWMFTQLTGLYLLTARREQDTARPGAR